MAQETLQLMIDRDSKLNRELAQELCQYLEGSAAKYRRKDWPSWSLLRVGIGNSRH